MLLPSLRTVMQNLYNNITYMYPDAEIWVVGKCDSVGIFEMYTYLKHQLGHSMGGSIAALIGVTFGVPAVAFEAPGEKLAASRLHLPTPVRLTELFCPRNLRLTIIS
jgi:putative lipase involved disintegration of autophagic bodies